MEFLLEIITEEMPSSHVKAALAQIQGKFEAELKSAHIAFQGMRFYGTCRRLIVVGDLAAGQADKELLLTGPPETVAFSADGAPTAAALGFAKSQKVEVSDLQVFSTAKGEYLGLKKIEKGKPAEDILPGLIPPIIASLSFPKMMKWGNGTFRFSRPIKHILCLFGGNALRFALERISSDDTTLGHKIHCPEKMRVQSFQEFKEALAQKKVIIDPEERKKMILSQVEEKLAPLKAELHPDEELLEKLTFDVEYPYVFLGSFPEEYLDLPLEVLSTAMREGQKLFSVVKDKKQLPLFLGVADHSSDPKSLIQKGNERVLKATLEDARFFWAQDIKSPLEKRAAGLKRIVFQEKLGSYEDKRQRLKKIVAYLCDKIDEKEIKKEAIQAAELCKLDLLTEMVREFPSLQGRVGGLYAKEEGYPALVSQAIYEHYQPLSLEDESPFSLAGALLSMADKLDSIVGVVGVGIEVSGSSDPFGLRRNAHGIIKIILDKKLNLSLFRLLHKISEIYGDKLTKSKAEILATCQNFFAGRLRFIYEKRGYRYDLVNAALGAGIEDIYASFLRLKALDLLKASPQFGATILLAKRVNNILRGQNPPKIIPEFFLEKPERELYSTWSIIEKNVKSLVAKGDFAKAQNIVFKLQPSLNGFFDRVLVMTEEKKIRQNRLALLQAISRLLIQMADYSEIVVEGEK